MESEIMVYNVFIVLFTLLSAFFSGVETTIVSSNKIKIDNLALRGGAGARRAQRILENTDSAIGMVLIGNNISNITATALITYVLTKSFMVNENELFIYTTVQALIFLIFCEIVPKLISKAKPESLLLKLSFPIWWLMMAFKPLIYVSLKISEILKKRSGIKDTGLNLITSKDDIATYFSIGKKEGVIDEERQYYISEILEFKNNLASEIMTPLIDIVSINVESEIRDLVNLIEKTKFSRIPVYEKKRENIIGYINYKDLLKSNSCQSLRDLIIAPTFIPTTKNVSELYGEMHSNRTPFLFVVNEYGYIVGILTVEDIAEEIVGEIQTDDHPEENLISKISEKKYDISGRLDIDYFQRFFSIKIEKRNFETVGGFITFLSGNIPKVGDKVRYRDFEFVVTESGKRTIDRAMLIINKRKVKIR